MKMRCERDSKYGKDKEKMGDRNDIVYGNET